MRALQGSGEYRRRDKAYEALVALRDGCAEIVFDTWDDDSKDEKWLSEFGRRIELTAIAIKTDIEEEPFHRFVGLLHEHHAAALSLAASESATRLSKHGVKGLEKTLALLRTQKEERRLAEELRELRLVHASVVMRDELIHDDRRLPRPTRIGLSRLAKDLWMASRLGERVVSDIVRPLGVDKPLEMLLSNLDMIDREELRADVVRLVWSEHDGDRALVAILKRLYESDILELDDLPDGVQSTLARQRKADECRDNPARFLGALDRMHDPDVYREHLLVALEAFPDLLRAHHSDEASRIVEIIERHKQPDEAYPWRVDLLDNVLSNLESYDLATSLVGVVTSGSSAVRNRVITVFEAMGEAALPILLRILTETDRRAACTDTAVALGRIAPPEWIVDHLTGKKLKPHTAHYLLKVLGEIGDVRHAIGIKGYVRHKHPMVRDAALEAAFLLGHDKAIPVLLRAIYDPNPDLVCRAIHFLERLEYTDKRYIKPLLGIVEPPPEGEEETHKSAPDAVQVAAIRALGKMGNLELGSVGTLEEHLLKVLPAPDRWRKFAIWRQTESHASDDLRVAVCDALAQIGTRLSMKRLHDQSGEPEQRVRVRMSRAAADIERRLNAS